jgi:hypothetical protein
VCVLVLRFRAQRVIRYRRRPLLSHRRALLVRQIVKEPIAVEYAIKALWIDTSWKFNDAKKVN